jgi:hypothetical protein
MSRGAAAPLGDERWSANGYHYTKTTNGWILTHRLLMEEKLGRALLPNERVVFKNRNKRDIRIENLELSVVKSDRKKLMQRKASIQDKIREYQAMLLEVDEELARIDKEKLSGVSS